ncbi:sulfite exporter TauE/SafE family protein [Novosphingobium sp. MMS21-SN21R]|uniref:sulfite exporter TauE/SafE family protein n=1 Tax=Novosphingobium sp. MMS21-SN21R TaxID=2969298 RepID=UPI00288885A9|nr:sulfite exporter TauE/SafE family protein [Novosphingobium sp. MMS21-SN21R]MDT0508193.1 sulfite exporter TauE/SafE family protein [Novosphingobium sp. MMS21-SN21R]
MLLADPATLIACGLAVILVGMAKGGFSGLGALGTPVAALVLPPSTAAAILLPILIVQDVVSVWSFRHAWDKWIVAWMLPGAVVGVGLGWALAAGIDEKALMGVLGAITLLFGLYRLWVERGSRVVAASTSPGWVGAVFGMATGFTSQVAHAGGPPFQMWVTPRKLPHLTYAGTNAILFAAINWIKVPSYMMLGAFTHDVIVAAIMLVPLAIATTLLSVRVVRVLRPERFYTIIYLLMVGLGGKLIADGFA